MYKLIVIGVNEPYLAANSKSILQKCPHLFCTKRFTDLIADLDLNQPEFHSITPVSSAIDLIKKLLLGSNVAILASGDPLYFGIGKTLQKVFSRDQLEFHPALSAVQRAAALFSLPWDAAKIVSLHGREYSHLAPHLLQAQTTFIFTDSKNSPAFIAQKLLTYFELIGEQDLPNRLIVHVAEDIGLPSQKIFSGTLVTCSTMNFSHLNVLCIQQPDRNSGKEGEYFNFGLTENNINHSRGLITKNEVRAATLHRLQLPRGGIFWDIGAGSGSISIEAARMVPNLTVYSVEHKSEEISNIKKNIVKFNCFNVIPIFGQAPEALDKLPPPDTVFIGGSGGRLAEIVRVITKKLSPKGRIVINGVIEKTILAAPEVLRANNLKVTASTIQVSRKDDAGNRQDFNPITIFTGSR